MWKRRHTLAITENAHTFLWSFLSKSTPKKVNAVGFWEGMNLIAIPSLNRFNDYESRYVCTLNPFLLRWHRLTGLTILCTHTYVHHTKNQFNQFLENKPNWKHRNFCIYKLHWKSTSKREIWDNVSRNETLTHTISHNCDTNCTHWMTCLGDDK